MSGLLVATDRALRAALADPALENLADGPAKHLLSAVAGAIDEDTHSYELKVVKT